MPNSDQSCDVHRRYGRRPRAPRPDKDQVPAKTFSKHREYVTASYGANTGIGV